jgi:Domain of unknown function (DUF4123)
MTGTALIGEAERRLITTALWPQGDATPGSVWAVLDCARDRRIYRELVVSRLDYQCLYSGAIATELKIVAPHMVELGPRYTFTGTLLSKGWGRNWGIFVRINDPTRLRHHLRSLLTVKTEDGDKLLFRFFDPRVLRRYLPTCTTEELRQVFGPVTEILVEGEGDATCILSYVFDGSLLRSRSIAMT